MKLKAGQRIAGVRELLGLSQQGLAELIGSKSVRIKNIENLKARVTEDELEPLGMEFPFFCGYLVYGGNISLKEMKESKNKLVKVAVTKIEVGDIPKGFGFEKLIK